MNVNNVTVAGRLTRDIELRYTASNIAVANIGIAINRKFKDKEETTFVDLTAWGKTAEVMNEHLRKGDPVYVEGRLTCESWEAKDGSKRSKTLVTVERFQFVGGKRDEQPVQSRGNHPPIDSSEIPF